MFTLNVFEILQPEGRSVLSPAQWGTGTKGLMLWIISFYTFKFRSNFFKEHFPEIASETNKANGSTCRLVAGSHVDKSCWYQNKIWLAIKVSALKILQQSWKFSTFFSAKFLCSVFWYCTIVFKLRMHSGKSWQNF